MFWPLILAGLIILLNIPLYSVDKRAGICVSIFAAIYLAIALGVYIMYRSRIRKEVVSFATQFGTEPYKRNFSTSLRFLMRCWRIIARFCG